MKNSLIIPVENQVREFDPKLLLACIAARRGFSAMIGSRWEIDNRIASFPRSVYLSKSMTARGGKMLQIMRKIGHEVVAWDEEALVHLPPETFFSRRISPAGIKHVSHLFAWGQDNADLWRQYPNLSPKTPIHTTGNPRGDMLRPEMRSFYAKEVKELAKPMVILFSSIRILIMSMPSIPIKICSCRPKDAVKPLGSVRLPEA